MKTNQLSNLHVPNFVFRFLIILFTHDFIDLLQRLQTDYARV